MISNLYEIQDMQKEYLECMEGDGQSNDQMFAACGGIPLAISIPTMICPENVMNLWCHVNQSQCCLVFFYLTGQSNTFVSSLLRLRNKER